MNGPESSEFRVGFGRVTEGYRECPGRKRRCDGCNAVIVPERDEPYPVHIRECVDITSGAKSVIGIYRGERRYEANGNGAELVVCPCLVSCVLPKDEEGHRKNAEGVRLWKWVPRPAMIPSAGAVIAPADREWADTLVSMSKKYIKYTRNRK